MFQCNVLSEIAHSKYLDLEGGRVNAHTSSGTWDPFQTCRLCRLIVASLSPPCCIIWCS